ncbi:MAG: phosphodiester glycosidase family protein [Methylacidiphilales bacterium]|nr:phosphodiester glycosidase family protein [Candidatus Methylacidiphilales bacterium]
MRQAWLYVGAAWFGLAASGTPAVNEPVPAGLNAVTFRGQGFLTRTVDPRMEDLRLFWNDDQGRRLNDFPALDKLVTAQGGKLVFAANAGMYEVDTRPVGLLVQNGAEQSPLNLKDGTGNFYMKPNGIFLVNDKHEALVVESSTYPALLSPAVWATQSGPLLVHGGDILPDFMQDSKNRKVRSGVGVRKNGLIVFAISRGPVNFYDFASLFLDKLKCPNALYLDGEISAFYVPGDKDPMPHTFGPIFGLVEKAKTP